MAALLGDRICYKIKELEAGGPCFFSDSFQPALLLHGPLSLILTVLVFRGEPLQVTRSQGWALINGMSVQ